jgi:hypothetical protein
MLPKNIKANYYADLELTYITRIYTRKNVLLTMI